MKTASSILYDKKVLFPFTKKSQAEIDFILNKKIGYEVKMKARRTDLSKLDRLTQGVKLEKSFIVSSRFSDLEGVIPGFSL